MSTNSDIVGYCDKCSRPIPVGKSYLSIGGWLICGICQWEESQRQPHSIIPEIDKWKQKEEQP